LVGQNSTQKPQALHRSTVIVTTPFAIPTSFHIRLGAAGTRPGNIALRTSLRWKFHLPSDQRKRILGTISRERIHPNSAVSIIALLAGGQL
jgi:hypothetical protein